MRFKLIILFNLIILHNSFSNYSFKDHWIEQLTSQLKNQIIQNHMNDSLGQSENNNYFLNFDPFSVMPIVDCNPSYFIEEIPPGHGAADVFPVLNNALCTYNNDNIFNLKHYGIIVWLPYNADDTGLTGYMASFEQLPDGEHIGTYVKNKEDAADRVLFKPILDEVVNYVTSNLNIPEILNNIELIVTMHTIKPIRGASAANKYKTETKTYFANSDLLNGKIKPYLESLKTFKSTEYNIALEYSDFFIRIAGYIEYFNGNYEIPSNATCFDFPELSHPADDFVDCHCTANLTENEVQFLYVISLFLKDFIPGPLSYNCQNQLDWENEIFTFYKNGYSGIHWKEFMALRLTEGLGNIKYKHLDVALYLFGTNFIDHNELTPRTRVKLIDYMLNIDIEATRFVEMYDLNKIDIINELMLSSVELNESEASEFISELEDRNLVYGLWNKFLNTAGGDAEKKFILTTNLTKIAHANYSGTIGESFFDNGGGVGKTFIWKLNPWYANYADHHNYSNANCQLDGEISFHHKHILSVEIEYGFAEGGYATEIEDVQVNSDEHTFNFDPFEIVAVMPGDVENYRWNTLCNTFLSDQQCDFDILFLPAISLAWFISNQNSEMTISKYKSALEFTSIGVSAVAVASATAVPALIVAGVVLTVDVTAAVVPSAYAMVLESLFPEIPIDERNEMVADVQTVANYFSIGAGVADMEVVWKKLFSYHRLSRYRRLGDDVLSPNLYDLNIDPFDKFISSGKFITDLFPDDAVMLATNLKLSDNIIEYINSMDNGPNAFKLIGWVQSKPFLKNLKEVSQIELLDKAIQHPALMNEITRLPSGNFEKLLEDMFQSNISADEFVTNPALVPALKYSEKAFPGVHLCN